MKSTEIAEFSVSITEMNFIVFWLIDSERMENLLNSAFCNTTDSYGVVDQNTINYND